jgi:hypothetical protein
MKRGVTVGLVLAACGGSSEKPDGGPVVDGGMPDAKVLQSNLELHTLAPEDMLGDGKVAVLEQNRDVLELHGTAVAEGLTLTINGTPVDVDAQHQWSTTIPLPAIDCDAAGLTPQESFLIVARNGLGESISQRVDLVRDPCPPDVTWQPTTVEDEGQWALGWGNGIVPCLQGTGAARTIDGTTPVTIRKYVSNFRPDKSANDSFLSGSGTGCAVAGLSPAPAGQNPLRFSFSVHENLLRPFAFTVAVKGPGQDAFVTVGATAMLMPSEAGLVEHSVLVSSASLPAIIRRGSGDFVVRVTATDAFGNVTTLPEYTFTLALIPGPVMRHIRNLNVGDEPDVPSLNALAGTANYGTSVGQSSARLAMRQHIFYNYTDEDHYVRYDVNSWTRHRGVQTWRQAFDREFEFLDEGQACPGTSPLGWGTSSRTVEFDDPAGLYFSAQFIGPGECLGACSILRIGPKSQVVLTFKQDGLGLWNGAQRQTFQNKRVFAMRYEPKVRTACSEEVEIDDSHRLCGAGHGSCNPGFECEGVEPPDDLVGVCQRTRNRITWDEKLEVLEALSFWSEGDLWMQVGFADGGWVAEPGFDSTYHAMERNYVEDYATIP